jgi:hypothetical protein
VEENFHLVFGAKKLFLFLAQKIWRFFVCTRASSSPRAEKIVAFSCVHAREQLPCTKNILALFCVHTREQLPLPGKFWETV